METHTHMVQYWEPKSGCGWGLAALNPKVGGAGDVQYLTLKWVGLGTCSTILK